MPTSHKTIPGNPWNHVPNDPFPVGFYTPGVFWNLPEAKRWEIIGKMPVSQRGAFVQAMQANGQGRQQSPYGSNIGDLLNTFFSNSGAFGSSGGRGGGGGGGRGGGGGPTAQQLSDAGLSLGLDRDKINAQRGYEGDTHNNRVRDAMMQQLGLNLQKEMGQKNYDITRDNMYDQSAARGALTTAGTATKGTNLLTQFQDLMKQYGFQQNQLDTNINQMDRDNAYQNQNNDFAQQGLNIQAGSGGFVNPFGIANPAPVQRKKV